MMLTLQDLLRTRTAQPPLNGALYFDGVDDYVEVASNPIENAFTIILWDSSFREPGQPVIYASLVGMMRDNNNGVSLRVSTKWPDRVYQVEWRFNGTSYTREYLLDPFNVWRYVTLTYDGATYRLYLDGVLRTYNNVPLPPLNPRIRIGHDFSWYPEGVKAFIAGTLIYSRTLSDPEIIHNMLNPNNPIRDGLVLWLDARACYASKNICYDLSGNNNHGTIYGAQVVTLPSPVRAGGGL
jgi:hypothetical protein